MDKKQFNNQEPILIDDVAKIARFYGFQPFNPPAIIKQDFDFSKNLDPLFYPAEKVALLRMYFNEKKMALPQPLMLYCERPFSGSKDKKKSNTL